MTTKDKKRKALNDLIAEMCWTEKKVKEAANVWDAMRYLINLHMLFAQYRMVLYTPLLPRGGK